MIARRLRSGVGPARCHAAPRVSRRWQSGPAPDALRQPVQAYISTSRDPYLNLSIEHHLLQKSDPESAILFLYWNRPSIIIGRNQNPWLEVNLALLKPPVAQLETEPPGIGAVDLVRRRSGGGTVFHDEGNVNWTVICPSADFTRDKHAGMVVRALRDCGVDRARVNARHDIVLDQGTRGADTDAGDTHSTPYEATDFATPRPLKVSGSAYKLTRNRALHHGTCLLNSPNLNIIPDYLHSPAKPFITAKGVESVSSPVGNILLRNEDFISAVQAHFLKQYDSSEKATEVDQEWLQDATVNKGYEELKSLEWTYLQTPQWSISSKDADTSGVDFDLSIKYGAICSASIQSGHGTLDITADLVGNTVHEITDWSTVLGPALKEQDISQAKSESLGRWLNKMLPSLN